jgi:hypothetical protein
MRRRLYHLIFPAIVSASLIGCATDAAPEPGLTTSPLAPGQILTTKATVRLLHLEGGCWTLKTDEGLFRPLVLPPQYQIDGLPVRVTLRDAPDYADYCMVGPLVHVDSITGILENGGP